MCAWLARSWVCVSTLWILQQRWQVFLIASLALTGESEPFVSWLLIKSPKVHSWRARKHTFYSLKWRENSRSGLCQRQRKKISKYSQVFSQIKHLSNVLGHLKTHRKAYKKQFVSGMNKAQNILEQKLTLLLANVRPLVKHESIAFPAQSTAKSSPRLQSVEAILGTGGSPELWNWSYQQGIFVFFWSCNPWASRAPQEVGRCHICWQDCMCEQRCLFGLSWTRITSEVYTDPRTALNGDNYCPVQAQINGLKVRDFITHSQSHVWPTRVFCNSRGHFSGHIGAGCPLLTSCLLFSEVFGCGSEMKKYLGSCQESHVEFTVWFLSQELHFQLVCLSMFPNSRRQCFLWTKDSISQSLLSNFWFFILSWSSVSWFYEGGYCHN